MQVGDLVDGRFRILELLGEGAAGRVFRAEDQGRSGMLVALKLLHAKDPRWKDLFRREFDVLSRLHHPNLVRVYDFGPAPADDTWYFTQELVVGKPLLDVVAGMKVDHVLALFIEICRALEFIHGHGVLHRDLKPANILVHKNAPPGERARVLDFGLWRELDNTPQKNARWAGTPPYLASEVLRGYGHSINADLYALGVTLFQAITRKLPHGRGTPQELLAARKEPSPSLSGRVQAPLAHLVARLLDENPAMRPQTAAEVAAELAALAPGTASLLPRTLGRARLVGRDAERARMSEAMLAVRSAQADAPRLVVVRGPDGAGKSRLVGEWKAEVQLEGGRAAIGRCSEEVQWSYRPIAEILRALAPRFDGSEMSVAEREVVERLCPERASPTAPRLLPGARAEQARFHQAAADIFLRMGASDLCMIVIEDVPCADAGTLAMLAGLLRRAAGSRVLVVVTAGPREQYGPLSDELIAAAEGHVLEMELRPLARSEIARLVAALLSVAVEDVPGPLIDTVEAHARGNPLLIEELIALFIERGDLQRGARGWNLARFDSALAAPAHLIGVLGERLQRLADLERRVLSALAVLGRPAGPKVLAAVAGVSVQEVQDVLTRVEHDGLVRVVGTEDGRSRVVFRHPQMRDALLDDLQRGDVLHLWHRNAAEVVEERATWREKGAELAETLAYHYEQARDLGAAHRWLLEAAEHALQSFAFDDALRLSRRAARAAPGAEVGPAERLRAELLIGRALFHAGRMPEARAYLEEAIARADPERAPAPYSELHLWLLRTCEPLGDVAPGRRALEGALARVDSRRHPLAHARLLIARGELNQRLEPTSALRDAEHALRLMPEPRGVEDELHAFKVLTVAAYWRGQRVRSVRYARHRVRLAEATGRSLERIAALRHLVVALAARGERLEARRHLNEALSLARDAGYDLETSLLLKALGDQLFVSGAYDEAIVRYQEAAQLLAQKGQVAERGEALRWLGRSYAARGEFSRAIEHLQVARAQLDGAGTPMSQAAVRCDLAMALLVKNESVAATSLVAEAGQAIESLSLPLPRAEWLCAQGELAMRRGDIPLGRSSFVESIALARRADDPFHLALSLVGYGQLLLRERQVRRALRMARRAEQIFRALDARGELKRLRPLLNAARGLSLEPGPALPE